MKIGLVGPSYQELSLPFDAQRTVNLYPVIDQNGKETAALYSVPGKSLFATCGSGPVRGVFSPANKRAFVVSGSNLYEIDSSGTATLRGSLLSSSGIVTFDENGFELFICDGSEGYIFTYASNIFANVTAAAFPTAGTVCFIDGYFVVNEVNSNKFLISGLYNGNLWAALDFASAESSPDNLIRVFNSGGQLWLLGEKTTEIWTNTGSTFPFQKISGAKINIGILSPYTALEVDNTLFWVGRDDKGSGIVYRASGFRPQRVSTSPIESIIQAAPDPDNLRSYSYQQRGHLFYVITGGGLNTSLCYDVTTGLWHERAELLNGVFNQDKAACIMYAFSKHLVGDKSNGNIYELSFSYKDDNGDPLCRERIYTHLSDEGREIQFDKLEIGLETGVGNQTGLGVDPICSMQLSKDGGRTWTDWHQVSFGAAGKYKTKVVYNRLGITDQMTFKIRITDPVTVNICGSYLNA